MDTKNPQGKTTQQVCWNQIIPAGEHNSSTPHKKPSDLKEEKELSTGLTNIRSKGII